MSTIIYKLVAVVLVWRFMRIRSSITSQGVPEFNRQARPCANDNPWRNIIEGLTNSGISFSLPQYLCEEGLHHSDVNSTSSREMRQCFGKACSDVRNTSYGWTECSSWSLCEGGCGKGIQRKSRRCISHRSVPNNTDVESNRCTGIDGNNHYYMVVTSHIMRCCTFVIMLKRAMILSSQCNNYENVSW